MRRQLHSAEEAPLRASRNSAPSRATAVQQVLTRAVPEYFTSNLAPSSTMRLLVSTQILLPANGVHTGVPAHQPGVAKRARAPPMAHSMGASRWTVRFCQTCICSEQLAAHGGMLWCEVVLQVGHLRINHCTLQNKDTV